MKHIESGFVRFAERGKYGAMVRDGALKHDPDGALTVRVPVGADALFDEALAVEFSVHWSGSSCRRRATWDCAWRQRRRCACECFAARVRLQTLWPRPCVRCPPV